MLLCFNMLSRSRLYCKVVATLFYGSTILLLVVHVSSIDRHLNCTTTSCLNWWWLTLSVSSFQSGWLVAALSPLSCCSVVFFSPYFATASPPAPGAEHSAAAMPSAAAAAAAVVYFCDYTSSLGGAARAIHVMTQQQQQQQWMMINWCRPAAQLQHRQLKLYSYTHIELVPFSLSYFFTFRIDVVVVVVFVSRVRFEVIRIPLAFFFI